MTNPADAPPLPRLRAIALAGLLGLPALGCGTSTEGRGALAEGPSTSVRRVEVVSPARVDVKRTVEQPGQVVAFETTPLYARIAGYVRAVSVNIGDRVKKRQVLAELAVPEVEADVEEKRASVDQARAREAQAKAAVEVARSSVASADAKLTEVRAGIRRAEADLARWQSEAGRTRQLVSERAATSSILDETLSKLKAAESSRDEVQAQVKSAEAALAESRAELDKARSDVLAASASIEVARAEAKHAEAMLGFARIAAPFDGVVTRRHVDTGHLTVPGASAAAPLFEVARTDLATVVVAIPEIFAVAVDPGDPVRIRLQALGGRSFEGKVTRTSWALDANSRTIQAEIDLPNPSGLLRPGLYAYATVVVEEHTGVWTLPISAVVKEKEAAVCFVVESGKAVRRPIALGIDDGSVVEVVSGLLGSERVAKAGAASLVDGQAVEVEAPASASPGPPGRLRPN